MSDFDFDSYNNASLGEILEHHKDDFGVDFDYGYCAKVIKYCVPVKYMGEIEEIQSERASFIKNWGKSLSIAEELIESYKHQVFVSDGDVSIQIPMQEQVIPFLKDEIRPDENISIYLIFAGVDRGRYVFLGTEFSKE